MKLVFDSFLAFGRSAVDKLSNYFIKQIRSNEKSLTLRCYDLHDGSELERLDDDDDDDDDSDSSSSDSDAGPAVEQKTTEIKDNTAQDLVRAIVLLSCGHEVGGKFHPSLVESLTRA